MGPLTGEDDRMLKLATPYREIQRAVDEPGPFENAFRR
jgi:hypothetical protein